MPTSPNSLTITATRRPCSAVRMRLSSVVLPDPRNPVRMMTEALEFGVFASAGIASTCARWPPVARSVDDRQLHLADDSAGWLTVFHLHISPYDRVDRHAFHLPATPRRRLVLAVESVGIDR